MQILVFIPLLVPALAALAGRPAIEAYALPGWPP